MGLFPNVLDEARAKGIDIAPKYIPAEVFDKRAVEKNQVVFHDVAYHRGQAAIVKKRESSVAVELTDFSVFYSQDSIANAEAALKNKGSRIVVEQGQIVKVSKDKDGIVTREVLTKRWTDWIDYWAVDFNFESKREIIRVQNEENGEWEERWTGDYIFENEWQSFRTKKDRSLELKSVFHECPPGRRKLAVKVVDIFGNDTMTIVDVNVGENLMAQADLLVDLIKSASSGDQLAFRKIAETLIQEEKAKGHRVLADRLVKSLQPGPIGMGRGPAPTQNSGNGRHRDLIYERTPERSLDSLVLPDKIRTQIKEIVEEQHRAELLHAHNLRARNRVLLAGPPGNGKTTLAEVLAYELMYPLFVVRYETLVGSYLGEPPAA